MTIVPGACAQIAPVVERPPNVGSGLAGVSGDSTKAVGSSALLVRLGGRQSVRIRAGSAAALPRRGCSRGRDFQTHHDAVENT